MTREEVIHKWVLPALKNTWNEKRCEEILKALEQDPCGDAISRQAVLDALDKSRYSNEFCEENHIDWSINLGMAHIVVNELKPVTPQPKMGHWIFDDKCKEHGHCSRCGYGRVDLVDGEPHNFCRKCGAKMVEPQERSEEINGTYKM